MNISPLNLLKSKLIAEAKGSGLLTYCNLTLFGPSLMVLTTNDFYVEVIGILLRRVLRGAWLSELPWLEFEAPAPDEELDLIIVVEDLEVDIYDWDFDPPCESNSFNNLKASSVLAIVDPSLSLKRSSSLWSIVFFDCYFYAAGTHFESRFTEYPVTQDKHFPFELHSLHKGLTA